MEKKRNEHLDKYKFKSLGKEPLGKKPVGVRVQAEDYERFMQIPKDTRNKLLRDFIRETGMNYPNLLR